MTTKLVRDGKLCLTRIQKTKDGRIMTKTSCRIQVPQRWMDVGLGELSSETKIYAFFPILFADNTYGVFNVCAMLTLLPSKTTVVTINEEAYYEFHFDEGTQMVDSTKLIRKDTITFNILDEMFMKGKVPWWATLDDLCSIFDTAKKHADSRIGMVPETIEFLAGVTTRGINSLSKPLRQTAETYKDYAIENLAFVSLKSVPYAVNNIVGKLSGAHFGQGIVSALVEPEKRASRFERIIKS